MADDKRFTAQAAIRAMRQSMRFDGIPWNGILDPLTADEAEEEANKSSGLDPEGDLVPGPNNNVVTSGPRSSAENPRLNMVHSSLLMTKFDGGLKYNGQNEINEVPPPPLQCHPLD